MRLKPTGNPPVGLLSICPEPQNPRSGAIVSVYSEGVEPAPMTLTDGQHSQLRWDRSPSLAKNSRLECATPESDTDRVNRVRRIRSMFIQPDMRAVKQLLLSVVTQTRKVAPHCRSIDTAIIARPLCRMESAWRRVHLPVVIVHNHRYFGKKSDKERG